MDSTTTMTSNPPPSPAVSVAVERVPSPRLWPWPSPLAVNACSLCAACFVVAMALTYVLQDHSPDSRESSFMEAALWFAAPHAAAAALALLAAGRRDKEKALLLSLAAMLFGAVSHCALAGFIVVAIVTHPRNVLIVLFGVLDVLAMVVGDAIGFLSLHHQLGEEEQDNEASV